MPNLKIIIAYDGTNFCGWQVQNCLSPACPAGRPACPAGRHIAYRGSEKPSIQETVEKALRIIARKKIRVICSGRTDAGVHAKGQVANFMLNLKIPLAGLKTALNSLLPDEITVLKISKVNDDFHSRFSAKSKVYRYAILNSCQRDSFSKNFVYFCDYPLDLALMRKEAKALLGRHDFSGFCASAGKKKNPLKNIKRINVEKQGDRIYIDIEADGFLYNMVRNIVGTLIEIGRGKFPKGSIKKILASRDRRLAGPTAPASGLCLMKVKY